MLTFSSGPAVAGDELVESGTFTLEVLRASFVGSVGYAKGVLTFEGKTRDFKAHGLGLGGYGVSKTKAWGKVYNLNTADDFTGTYVMARSGITVGEEEMGNKRWVSNDRGVKLEMNVDTKGLQLNLGADGMMVSWDD